MDLEHRGPALDGVLVADFSRVLAGPLASMVLADLGADVVKVERPEGDDTRGWGPPFAPDGTSTYFQSVNRNKRSLVLDLRRDADVVLARRLAARADVLIENFRPGTMERLGLGIDDLMAANPRLVACSITGFGPGEGAALPGYDLLVQAVGGLMSVTGPDGGPPTKVGVALVDVVAGLFATVGILAALRERDASGRGQRVEVSLLSALLAGLVNQTSAYLGAGAVERPRGNRHPSIAPYETFATADGDLAIAVGTDRQFAALSATLGVPELASDERFSTNALRVANIDALHAELAPPLLTADRATWTERLNAAAVPAGPVNDIAEAIALAERLGLEPVVDAGGARQVADPIRLSASPAGHRTPPPALGADSAAVRTWLARD